MQNLIEKTQKRHDDTQARTRAYLAPLLQRLLVTYGVPLTAALFISTIGAMLISQILPDSTTSLLALVLNVLVIFYGWRAIERRTRATASFVLYTHTTRERRALARLLAQTKAGETLAHDALARQAQAYEDTVNTFIQSMEQP